MKHTLRRCSARRRVPLSLSLLVLSTHALSGCASDTTAAVGEPEPVAESEPEMIEPVAANAAQETDPEPRDYGRPYELIEGEPMFKILEEDGIPSIDEPVFVSREDADAFMDLDETVLGVVGANGTAKCYSAWQLDSHEIVNDVLDGAPIAATW